MAIQNLDGQRVVVVVGSNDSNKGMKGVYIDLLATLKLSFSENRE